MMGPDPYSSNLQNNSMVSPSSGGMIHNMRLPFNSMVSSVSKLPTDSNSLYHGDGSKAMAPHGMTMSEPIKKKRGRPRKYGPDGNMALALAPLSSVPGYSNATITTTTVITGTATATTPPSSLLHKPIKGRPPGLGKKQHKDALGSAGIGFTPHVITVKAGEDVASKIMSFSQQGPRTVCILSANGAISNVTLRQPATSGGTVTYEGRFEIISLSGSYLLTESDGTRSRTGGLSVSLAGPDGRVLGGGVAGLLMAATPIQVIVGSFMAEGKKPKPNPVIHEPSSVPSQMVGSGAAEPASPPSRGTMSGSSGGPGSPVTQNASASNNINHPVQNMPSYAHVVWAGSQPANQHRHEADMSMIPN